MKKTVLRELLLALVTLVMLCGFALAIPSGRITDEADERYREMQLQNDEDNWLLQYHTN